MPWGALPHVMASVASRIGISAVKAKGEYGEIQSNPGDTAVFARYAQTGSYDKLNNDLVGAFFRKYGSGTFIDIGANIGLTTIPVAQNPTIQCFAFEPEPVNFENLAANISANCCHGNVTIKQVALFDRTSIIEFEAAEGNLGDHRIRLSNQPGQYHEQERRIIKVKAISLDEVIGEISGPLAVKIDTQGAEPFVIGGGRQVLAKAGLLILEFWPYGAARLDGDLKTVIDFLEKTFDQISIIHGEDDSLPDPLPRAEACAKLREMILPAQAAGSEYWNIIAYKQAILRFGAL